nr:hypothetical protein [Tanacetum cinerariifolium]
LPAAQGDAQLWISDLAKEADAPSSFNELLDTPIDFSNFIMHRLNVDTLTPDLLAGPTYELMRGSCSSLTELTDQLDWVNPEGQQYPHNLLQPLPLIPDNRGRQIMEWHDYKHLDWISVRRDDDQIYKFKEGDFKRLRLQDIEDMLLLLVQGKLSNLTVEERLAFNVSLRMFTRSIVIQRSDLRRREAYTVYSNPRGFIYQNKDKKNRLIRIDELHKKGDKDRAAAMIQAIEKNAKDKEDNEESGKVRWWKTRKFIFPGMVYLMTIQRTLATTIEQQVALDEALVPSTKRLRIRRSNFRLPSDIQSKESTLQVVYDVLRRCPFFQAFLVTADVPEIYMQEFWATQIATRSSS